MLSRIDEFIFPDRCDGNSITSQQFVYPIFKNGSSSLNGHYGLKHSEETKQKMKDAQAKLGYTHNEETKLKMKEYTRTAEHAEKLGNALRGKPWSEARRNAQINKGAK